MSTHTQQLQRWIVILGASLLLLIGAMAFLMWQDKQQLPQSTVHHSDATQIRIQRQGFVDIHLSKTAELWQIDNPCTISANEQRLEPLLGALTPGPHLYNASEVDLEAAGLLTPQAIVFINETEHRIGNTDLHGERRYQQIGNKVGFIPEWVLSLVNGGITAFAKLRVLPDAIDSLVLVDSDGVETQISSTEDIQQWKDISAQQIVSWPTDDFRNEEPAMTLLATTQAGDELGFSIYHTERYTAITSQAADCAYILPLDSLPD